MLGAAGDGWAVVAPVARLGRGIHRELPPQAPRLPNTPLQLPARATALALSWVWDIRSERPPPWFARLRSLLTAGAGAGLAAGALS